MPTVHIIIPTYNEAATLGQVLDRIDRSPLPDGWSRRVYVIDDGSTDDTPDVLDKRPLHDLVVLRHETNKGKGAALRTGYAELLARVSNDQARRTDAVLIHDADLEYDPADHAALLQPIASGESRVVYGRRFGAHYRPGRKRARIHALGNRILTALSNLRTGYAIHDMECCNKAMTLEVLAKVASGLMEDSFGVEPEVTARLAQLEEPIVERPVTYDPRSVGQGKKIKWRDGYHALRVILKTPSAPDETVRSRSGHGLRLILQVLGFAVGISLLWWCVDSAIAGGQFEQLRNAHWALALPLVGCTLVSMLANGAIFWAIIRPLRRLPFWDIQLVNAVVNLLNYAPIRLGLVTRLAHHRRVDHMHYSALFAWYAAFAVLMFMVLGCVLFATLFHPALDLAWVVILSVFLAIGATLLMWAARTERSMARWRSAAQILALRSSVWPAVGLRLIDMTAYAGRLYFSLRILGHDVSGRDAIILALISMVATLVPVGSLGIREFAVARLGPILADATLVNSIYAAIVVDRAGEAVVFLPTGLIALAWMIRRWSRAQPGSPR